VVVCAVLALDELVEVLPELAVLVDATLVADVVESSPVASSSLDFVAAAVVALVASCVVAAGWSATIAPPMPRKLATLSAATARRAFCARGLRRARGGRLTGDTGVLSSFMPSTVSSVRIDCARAG
jgi:chromate transport protein ChrA